MDTKGKRTWAVGASGLLRAGWSELGSVGRVGLVALVVSAVIAISLAVVIPNRVENFLVASEVESLSRVVDDLITTGLIEDDSSRIGNLDELDVAVQRFLLGRDAVRVKLWARDGTVLYSNERELIGQQFDASKDLLLAFEGTTSTRTPDLSRPENIGERDLGPLTDFYIPVEAGSGSVFAVFEVYEDAERLLATVSSVRRSVWISIIVGIGFLALFTTMLFVRNAQLVIGQRQEAERLVASLVRAQEDERKRVMGALHDDIGQPLYRIHYGIEECRALVESETPVDAELAHVDELVLEVEQRLLSALRALSDDPKAELDLIDAIAELVETTELETDLSLSFEANGNPSLAAGHGASLHRAAREAVTNARKHAEATSVFIKLFEHDGTVFLEVVDDGIGFPGSLGLGLTAARDRLESVGGGLKVASQPEAGTRFSAWVPRAKVQRGPR